MLNCKPSICSRSKCALLAGLLATLTGPFIPVHADASASEKLPDIIVTAQKTSQSIEQAPVSVSALSGKFVNSTNSTSFADLQNYTGNVNIQISPDSAQIGIRGFDTPNSNPGFDPSVGTVIDGVFYGRPQFLSAFFYDIGSFEVLRGPQGTLFGKNTTAGLLDLETAEPKSNFLLRSELFMTSYGQRSYRPVLQFPVGQDLSVRVSANLDHGNRGVLYNTFLNRPEVNPTQNSLRVRARYTPTESLLIDVEGFVSTSHQNENLFQLSRVTPAMKALVLSYDKNADFSANNHLTSADIPARDDNDIRGLAATVQYDFSQPWEKNQLTLKSITGLAQARNSAKDLDADFSPVPFIRDSLLRPSPYRQFSEELRISGKKPSFFGLGHRFNYVAGLYYSHSTLNASNLFSVENLGGAAAYIAAADLGSPNPLLPGGLIGGLGGQLGQPLGAILNLIPGLGPGSQSATTLLDQKADDYAFYGQFEEYFLPHWAVIVGIRLGLEYKTGSAFSKAQGALVPLISNQRDFSQDLSRLERSFSPKLGVQWSPDKRSSVYFTWTRGFKSGGFNAMPLNDTNLQYGPERASSFELGGKILTRLWGTPLRTSVDVFWTTFKNLQVSTLQNANFIILNAAAARSRGFDFDLNWLPLPRASLYLSAGFADATYTRYPNAPTAADASSSTQDLAGRPLAYAPRWTLAFIPGYTVPLPLTLKAHFYLDVLFQDSHYLNIDDDAREQQPATTIFNARMMLNGGSHLWSLSLAAHNLTDKVILDQVVDQPLAPGNFAAVRSDYGRFYSADIAFNFD